MINMRMSEFWRKRFVELLRFGVAGGLSFVIDFSVLILCQEFCGLGSFQYGVLFSTGLAFLVSVAFHYWISSIWVFEGHLDIGKSKHLIRGVAFFTTCGIGFLLTEFGMWIGVSVLCYNYIIVKLLVTGCVMIWNYLTQKLLIFR